jgi:hypothetical protein
MAWSKDTYKKEYKFTTLFKLKFEFWISRKEKKKKIQKKKKEKDLVGPPDQVGPVKYYHERPISSFPRAPRVCALRPPLTARNGTHSSVYYSYAGQGRVAETNGSHPPASSFNGCRLKIVSHHWTVGPAS